MFCIFVTSNQSGKGLAIHSCRNDLGYNDY